MGDLTEFSLPVRLFLKAYRWRQIVPLPWAPLRQPLAAARLALVSSAGFVTPDQAPFDRSVRGGDCSFREIPSDVRGATLVDTHRSESFDHSGMLQDSNLAIPVDRVRELVERGRVGSLARHHLSFMGSITAPTRLIQETAPAGARKLVDDAVDVALLVPV
jgi:D-proline reductase (dithiol) PrdB